MWRNANFNRLFLVIGREFYYLWEAIMASVSGHVNEKRPSATSARRLLYQQELRRSPAVKLAFSHQTVDYIRFTVFFLDMHVNSVIMKPENEKARRWDGRE